MKTPNELRIKKGTVIEPEGGWLERRYYIVYAAFSAFNPIHRYIFFTGFLDSSGRPNGYNQFFGGENSISDTYYLEAISLVEGIGGDGDDYK